MRLVHGETVTVKRYAQDPFGDTVLVSQHEIPNCSFRIMFSNERLDSRTNVVTTARMLAPDGSDIKATDRVERSDGSLWDVTGDPNQVKSPLTGWRPGMTVTLTRATG